MWQVLVAELLNDPLARSAEAFGEVRCPSCLCADWIPYIRSSPRLPPHQHQVRAMLEALGLPPDELGDDADDHI